MLLVLSQRVAPMEQEMQVVNYWKNIVTLAEVISISSVQNKDDPD